MVNFTVIRQLRHKVYIKFCVRLGQWARSQVSHRLPLNSHGVKAEHLILQPLPPQCWDCSRAPPCLIFTHYLWFPNLYNFLLSALLGILIIMLNAIASQLKKVLDLWIFKLNTIFVIFNYLDDENGVLIKYTFCMPTYHRHIFTDLVSINGFDVDTFQNREPSQFFYYILNTIRWSFLVSSDN